MSFLTHINAEASSSRHSSPPSPSSQSHQHLQPLHPPPPGRRRTRNRIKKTNLQSPTFLLITLFIILVLPLISAKKSNLFPMKPVMGNKRINSNTVGVGVGVADTSAGAKSYGGRRAIDVENDIVQPRKGKNVAVPAQQPQPQPPTNPQQQTGSINVQPATKIQPRQIAATARMGRRKKKDNIPKEKKDYSSFLCPGGSLACPISPPPSNSDSSTTTTTTTGAMSAANQAKALESQLNSLADWFRIGFECWEVDNDVENCGACVSLGQGQDCTLIPHSRSTGCESGTCQVYQCQEGFIASSDKRECVRRGSGNGFGGGGGQKAIGK